MYINRFFRFFLISCILAGCADLSQKTDNWSDQYGTFVAEEPTPINYGAVKPDDETHNLAVLLPLSGNNAATGRAIRTSVEMAILEKSPTNLTASFFDTARGDINETISTALSSNPDAIVGPLFSDNVKLLRSEKPSETPVISFTSDASAVGDGVYTMALMPTNSVETIVREIHTDGAKNFIIIAPNTKSGRMMAGTALTTAKQYDLPPIGVFYYNEKDSESIKNMTIAASMNNARTAANTRARQVLSDIMINEQLTAIEKSNLDYQLDKLSKIETLGRVPYDAILFLGNSDDTITIASFLRYYNVSARDAKFYGTALWDGASDISSDYTMSGAKFAVLPPMGENFVALYQQISGDTPNRLSSFGYDGVNMAINMIYSGQDYEQFLSSPNGYMGTDGLLRLNPNGTSERALRIMALDGSGTPREIKSSATSFTTPLYIVNQQDVSDAEPMDLESDGIDPDNYIQIPSRLQSKYNSDIIGANSGEKKSIQKSKIVAILGANDETTITSTDYVPVKQESVNRTLIDSVEIEE